MSVERPILTTMKRGDTRDFAFVFTDYNDAPINVSGHKIFVMFKASIEDADGAAALSVEHTIGSGSGDVPASGLAVVSLPSDQTKVLAPGNYLYEFQYVDTSRTPLGVFTIQQGTVTIEADVVRGDT